MQKKILAASVAILSAPAALAGLTLFGSFDVGFQSLFVGQNGAENVRVSRLTNGLLRSSKLGVKAEQSIMNSTTAGFVGEMLFSSMGGFSVTPGSTAAVASLPHDVYSPHRLFSGDLYLFIDGCLGKFVVGRHSDMYASVATALDAVEGGTSATVFNLIDPFDMGFRHDNNLSYHSPDMYGVTVSALLSLGDQHTPIANMDSNREKAKVQGSRGYGFAAQFEDGPLYAGTAMTYKKVSSATVAAADATGADRADDVLDSHLRLIAGASYDLCFMRPSASVFYASFMKQKAYGGHVGVTLPLAEFGSLRGTAGVVQVKEDDVTEVINRAMLVGAAYHVELTNNFSVFFAAAYMTNSSETKPGLHLHAATQTSFVYGEQPGLTATTGQSPYSLEMGLNFSF